MSDKFTSLERLKALLDLGALTQDEFEREKALILSGAERQGMGARKVPLLVAGAIGAIALGTFIASSVFDKLDETNPSVTEAKPATSPTPTATSTSEAAQSPVDPYAGAKKDGCRQSTCFWEKVLEVRPVKRASNGVLKIEESYQGTMNVGSGSGPSIYSPSLPIKWEKVQTYVFCSTEQPSTAFKNRWGGDGGWIAHLLDLFDTYGYNSDSAKTYMRVCHGVDFYRQDIEKTLLRLGYSPGTRNEQVSLDRPDDLVSPPAAADGY